MISHLQQQEAMKTTTTKNPPHLNNNRKTPDQIGGRQSSQNQEHQPVDRLGPTLPFRCDHMTLGTKMYSPPKKPPDRGEKVYKHPPLGNHTDT